MHDILDIAIIGAGAAGLSAAINAAARGRTVRIFSNKSNYLARAKRVDNYLGFYQINGADLMNSFRDHAESMGLKVEIGKVINILPFEDYLMINFNGNIVEAKTVIIAVGVAKLKPIDGEEEFLGKGVSYCATCDGMLYRGKSVVVCGQADDIVEEANFLQGVGANVTFVSPKSRPEHLNEQIRFYDGAVQQIVGGNFVEAVKVKSEKIETKGVFVLRNALAPATLIDGLALENGFICVDRRMATNINGVFACGDCVGMPLQVAKAVGEGLIAAQEAAKYIEQMRSDEK